MEQKIKDNNFETKYIEIKNLDNGEGRFCGYASVFNIVDSYGDIILQNAFKNTIKNRKYEIKLLWQHKQDEPIGYFELMKEDSVGLYVEGKIILNLERGKEAYNLIKSGVIKGLSIGFNIKKAKVDKNNHRVISEVDLWEISIVTFPANEYSNITYCKSNEKLILELNKKLDRMEKILSNVS